MRFWIVLISFLFLLLGCACSLFSNRLNLNKSLDLIIADGNAELYLEDGTAIHGFEKEGVTHFFLPAYVRQTGIDQSLSSVKVYQNGALLKEFPPEEEIDVSIDTGDGSFVPWKLAFHRGNMPAVFVDLGGITPEDIEHGLYSPAGIRVMKTDGSVDYAGKKEKIKGRGNDTWGRPKSPYTIKLSQSAGLCGMNTSKKWILLANFNDPTSLLNKMVLDAQEKLEVEYSPHAEWVDLYFDGNYHGLYLLCEKMEISESKLNIGDLKKQNEALNPQAGEDDLLRLEDMKGFRTEKDPADISGGYIMEKTSDLYYEYHSCGFITNRWYFNLRDPNNASIGELKYVRDYMEEVDLAFLNKDPDLFSRIDTESFAKRFLLEEVFDNGEFAANGYYFYKKAGNEKLFAGPGWDYDRSCGNLLDKRDPALSVLERNETALDWDRILYEDKDYRNYLISVFRKYQDVFEAPLKGGIDRYVEQYRASFNMDLIRWGDWTRWECRYHDPVNNVRYIRQFLAKRIIALCGRWGVETDIRPEPGNGTIHTVTFVTEGAPVEIQVMDGETVPPEQFPEYDTEKYTGWFIELSECDFDQYIPVLEDMTIQLKED